MSEARGDEQEGAPREDAVGAGRAAAPGADAAREDEGAPREDDGASAKAAPAASEPGAAAAQAAPAEWRALALPLVILAALALYILLTRRGDPQEPHQDAKVRILLVDAAPELRLGLEGSWRLTSPASGIDMNVAPGDYVLDAQAWALRPAAPEPAKTGAEPAKTAAPAKTGASPAASGGGLPHVLLTLKPAARGVGPAPAFGLGDRRYRGELRLARLPDGRVRAINVVELEDYLAGVIGHEMPLSWSDEALKAQAIASRSYAVRELKPGREYDLERDTRSQVYRGLMAEDARARDLVEATRGLVIKHQGQVVVAYFHSTCGGDTVPASWVFDWVKEDTPPLMGASDCRCQASKYYRWEQVVDLAQVKGLTVALPLKELRIEHHPRGGYVSRVTLVGAQGRTQAWQGYAARSRFGLRAPAFEGALTDGGRKARFQGRGWGHGVGLCQWGAQGFSLEGWSAEQILQHFYPGVTVEPLRPAAP
ncbi:MAG: SpoIID/LytB domain-containing protein [Planctomycetota bacterium]